MSGWREAIRSRRADGKILGFFFLVIAVIFALFKLASEVMEGETLAFDRQLMMRLRDPSDPTLPIGPRWLRSAMLDITTLGGVTLLTLLTIIVVGYLVARRKRATALFVASAVMLGAAASTVMKVAFARPRPDLVPHLVEVHTASFPSGHAMNSAIVYLTLGALLARTESRPAVRVYILSAAIMLTLFIGSTRVYLGVHWPSDVMAGWMTGALWALLCTAVAQRLQRRAAIEQPT